MKTRGILTLCALALLASLSLALPSQAVEYTSQSFIVKDPVLGAIGGTGTSGSFRMFSSGEFVITGRSTTPSFIGRFGFLYFPFVTEPTLNASNPTDNTVDLDWTASTAGLGFSVSGYEVGHSTTNGGPYTFVNVGNVLLSTRTGLIPGTTQYFVVRTLDAFGTPIVTSDQVSIMTTGTPPPPPPSGGGGSSGTYLPTSTAISLTGEAYPQATVVFLKNGVERARTRADDAGIFQITLEEIFNQTVLYSIYALDLDGRRSLLLNYPISLATAPRTSVTGIRFAPTLIADKLSVKKGDDIIFSGFALPLRQLLLSFKDGGVADVLNTTSLGSGRYRYALGTQNLPKDDYEIRAQYDGDQRTSSVLEFMIGDVTILRDGTRGDIPGDCNFDKVINLRDFSVLAFWYQKPNPPACIDTNNDKIINLIDFSILAFYWSG